MGSTFFSLHYIATQETHHRKHSLVEELKELLNAAGIEFAEMYLL